MTMTTTTILYHTPALARRGGNGGFQSKADRSASNDQEGAGLARFVSVPDLYTIVGSVRFGSEIHVFRSHWPYLFIPRLIPLAPDAASERDGTGARKSCYS